MVVGAFVVLVVVAGVFVGLERLFGVRRQRVFRTGWRADLGWLLMASFVTKYLAQACAIAALVVALVAMGVHPKAIPAWLARPTWITELPMWLQLVLLFVGVDFLSYWLHRAFHRFGLLWRIHAVHHSSKALDWLASVRNHPLEPMIRRPLVALVLVLVGFRPEAVAIFVPVLAIYGLLLHANVPWTFGSLRWLVGSPVYHQWHHASPAELQRSGYRRSGCNFAGLLPIFDLMFGTFHLPKGERPASFGVGDDSVPDTFWGQLTHPVRFRTRSQGAEEVA